RAGVIAKITKAMSIPRAIMAAADRSGCEAQHVRVFARFRHMPPPGAGDGVSHVRLRGFGRKSARNRDRLGALSPLWQAGDLHVRSKTWRERRCCLAA